MIYNNRRSELPDVNVSTGGRIGTTDEATIALPTLELDEFNDSVNEGKLNISSRFL